jgi:hypothetical protein
MINNDRPEQVATGSVSGEKPASVALVPLAAAVRWSHVACRPRSRADFIAQLIATAEQLPQTRTLRRASPADAEVAYGSHRQSPPQAAGSRTRQII